MKINSSFKCIFLLSIILFYTNNISAQCTNKISHVTGTQTIDGVDVTVTDTGSVDTTPFCPNAEPYFIGYNSISGSYTFHFSPPVDSISLNVHGIGGSDVNKEIVKININGVHYSIPEVGGPGLCPTNEALPLITDLGDLTGQVDGSNSGCNDIIITGPINEITLLDSVVNGSPSGVLFSIFFCSEFISSTSENDIYELEVYPVPANDKIRIKGLTGKNIKISLVDALGRSNYISSSTQANEVTADVSEFPSGIYFLVIESDGKRRTRNIVIE